jgi:hypothetical protein
MGRGAETTSSSGASRHDRIIRKLSDISTLAYVSTFPLGVWYLVEPKLGISSITIPRSAPKLLDGEFLLEEIRNPESS